MPYTAGIAMNPMNRTPYGSRNRYRVARPELRIFVRRLRPARTAWVLAEGSSSEVTAMNSAVLLLVGLEDAGGLLRRRVERLGRVLLAEDGGPERVVKLLRRVTDAGYRRREVHVRHLLGERLEVREALDELVALRELGLGRHLGALRPLGLVLGEPVDEVPRRRLLVGVVAAVLRQDELVAVAPDAALAADLRQRRGDNLRRLLAGVVDLPDALPVERVLAVLQRDVVRVLADVLRAVALLDEIDHPVERLLAGVGVPRRLGGVGVVQVAAELPQQRHEHEGPGELERADPGALDALALQLVEGVQVGVLVGGDAADPRLVEQVLVHVQTEVVDVDRDAEPLVLVHAALPDGRRELRLLQIERLRDRVDRHDDLLRRLGRDVVDVHDRDVRAVAALDCRGKLLEEVGPLVHVHVDVDLRGLRVDL